MIKLRCDSKLHGILSPASDMVEFKCRSVFCGARSGIVVLHQFSTETGEMVGTVRYRQPPVDSERRKEQ